MSTPENKPLVQLTWYGRIGDWVKKNQGDIALVAGFILVALISFGAGFLSAPGIQKSPLIIENLQSGAGQSVINATAGELESPTLTTTPPGSEKGIIVASKNSKIYHWPWCAPAKQIKLENQIWFKSEAEAKASGRTKCADFDKLAPAGYLNGN